MLSRAAITEGYLPNASRVAYPVKKTGRDMKSGHTNQTGSTNVLRTPTSLPEFAGPLSVLDFVLCPLILPSFFHKEIY